MVHSDHRTEPNPRAHPLPTPLLRPYPTEGESRRHLISAPAVGHHSRIGCVFLLQWCRSRGARGAPAPVGLVFWLALPTAIIFPPCCLRHHCPEWSRASSPPMGAILHPADRPP